MKYLRQFFWVIPILVLIFLGLYFVNYSREKVNSETYGYVLHQQAERALENGEYEKAYELYLFSSYEFDDPRLAGKAITEAANVAWGAPEPLADYDTLVGMYKEALRNDPGQNEASWNLELLYWLKDNAQEYLPEPEAPGQLPGEEQVTSGDI